MPHIQLDYSANLENLVDMGHLCNALRAKAATIDAFSVAGIRVRAVKVDHYAIADGDPKHGFIDLSVRLREGRPEDIKRDAIEQLFETLKSSTAPALAEHSIALSAEIRDINAALSPKFGTIRDHMKDTA